MVRYGRFGKPTLRETKTWRLGTPKLRGTISLVGLGKPTLGGTISLVGLDKEKLSGALLLATSETARE